MADKEFLSQLRSMMVEVLHQEVPKIIDDRIDSRVPGIVRAIVHEEISSLMEHQIMPQFEDIQSEFSMLHREISRLKYQIA